MLIRPAGAELFYVGGQRDGQTDITKLTVAFRNTANALKNDDRVRGREDGDNVDDDGYTSTWSEGRGRTALACY